MNHTFTDSVEMICTTFEYMKVIDSDYFNSLNFYIFDKKLDL